MDFAPLEGITLIVPYYRNPDMLREQLRHWSALCDMPLRFVVIDDGSPEPALDVLARSDDDFLTVKPYLEVYRIVADIPWNRGGARNLGTHVAKTDWILHMDIDHVLERRSAKALIKQLVFRGQWYRFPRYRVGTADDTRKKDKIPANATHGRIHPHVDSYLCTKNLYWRAGGYDEDYSGCLGGGTPFLQEMEKITPPVLMPPEVYLNVYTRSVIKDASDWSLSRDTAEFSRRKARKKASGRTKPTNPLRFEWKRVL